MKQSEAYQGADLLADILGRWKTRPVFHVPGEGILEILDSLATRQPQLPLVSCRQETGMAFMADASARFGDEPGVCLVGRAPGALNSCLGVYTAFTDSVPLIMIIGQASSGVAGREAYLGSSDFQSTFGPMAKWVAEVPDAARIPEFLSRAYHTSLAGRRGPVVLVVSEEVLAQKVPVEAPEVSPGILQLAPSQEDIHRLQALLSSAEKPMLILGGTGWDETSCDGIAAFAKSHQLPIATSYRRRDLVDHNSGSYAGELGIGVNPRLVERVMEADLLLVIGMRLGELNTIGKGVFQGYTLLEHPEPKQFLIHVHADPTELNRVYRAGLAINASPEGTARALSQLAAESVPKARQQWLSESVVDAKEFAASGSCPGPLDLKSVFNQLADRLPDDAIWTSGAGGYALWPQRYVRHTHYGTQAGPKSGAMGYGLPAAISLKLCCPERTVVAVAGDGCFLMNGEELATAVLYNVPILIIVVNNNAYGAIKLGQERLFRRSTGVDLRSPDFAEYARSFGAFGERVARTGEFLPALSRALESKTPALLELVTSTDTIKPEVAGQSK